MSTSSASPIKSSSSDSRRMSSHTTSVMDISSKSSFSSNNSRLSDLKKRVELLNIQLKQRDTEILKERFDNEGQKLAQHKCQAEQDQLRLKAEALNRICEDLTQWIEYCEAEEQKRLKNIEDLYKSHADALAKSNQQLKSENGKLKHRIGTNETKNAAVVHENGYLRWENENFTRELDTQKRTIEEKEREVAELKVETASLKLNQRQVNQVHSARVERVVQSVTQNSATQLAKLKLQYDDREKEYGITLTRIRNEQEFLKKELDRREGQVSRLTKMLDELTLDNKRLFEVNSEIRKESELELDKLRGDIARSIAETQAVRDENVNLNVYMEKTERGILESGTDAEFGKRMARAAMDARLEAANSTIRSLRAQIREMNAVNVGENEPRADLRKKCIEVCELGEQIRQLEKECEEERAQRVNSTQLLIEMGQDMKTLIEEFKKYER